MLFLGQRQFLARRRLQNDAVGKLLREREIKFDGSRSNIVHLLRTDGGTDAEVRALRTLLDEMDERP